MTTGTSPSGIPPSEPDGLRTTYGIRRAFFILFLGVFLGVGGYLGYDAYSFLTTPASRTPRDITFDILPGSTFDRAAWDLYKAGALKDVFRFRVLAKLKGKLGSIQAGEFVVNTGWTPGQLLAHLTSGKAVLYKLALREGLAWWEVARLVEEGGFAKADEFEKVIHDPVFLQQYGIPFANAEGFLYPETYLMRKPRDLGGRVQAEIVARILIETFWKRTWPVLTQYAKTDANLKGSPIFLPDFTLKNNVPVRTPPPAEPVPAAPSGTDAPARVPREIPSLQAPVSSEALRYLVILASLVEKETGVGHERARVAGVYDNRMRIGMPLQCDPTVIYGLGRDQSGPIRRSQLDDAGNLYNTYKHPGLPPGPVCSSGAASILAAAVPEDHKYLYFVATGLPDGTHTFSTTLRDHEKAVRVYRATQGR